MWHTSSNCIGWTALVTSSEIKIEILPQVNVVWLYAHWLVRQSNLRHFWLTGVRRWAPYEDGSESMYPRTGDQHGRRSMVGWLKEFIYESLPCLHYHFPLNFLLHCHCVLWLSYESAIASSFWFLNDPWLGFTLADIFRPLPLLAPDWLTINRCILRHWNKTIGYYATRSGRTHTNTSMLCYCKLAITYCLHATHRLWRSLACHKGRFSIPEIWLFQSCSVLRKMTKVLGGYTCLLLQRGSQ